VQNVTISFRISFPAAFFTHSVAELPSYEKRSGQRETQEAVEKKQNRAGATPLFRLRAAQKVFGVAPALRHRVSVPYVFSHGQESLK
jgi:hypothetical protein